MKKVSINDTNRKLFAFVLDEQFGKLIEDISKAEPSKQREFATIQLKDENLSARKIFPPEDIKVKINDRTVTAIAPSGWSVCVNLGAVPICYAF